MSDLTNTEVNVDGSVHTSENVNTEGMVDVTMPSAEKAPVEQEWYYAKDIKGDGPMPEWYDPKQYPTVEDQAKAARGLRQALSKKDAVLESAPDEYTLDLGEDLNAYYQFNEDDPLMQSFMSTAKEHNISQSAFNDMVKSYVSSIKELESAADQQLLEELGSNGRERVNELANWTKNVLGEDVFESFNQMVKTIDDIKALEKIKDKMTKSLNIAGEIDSSPIDLKAQAKMELEKGAWKTSAAEANKLTALYEKAYR